MKKSLIIIAAALLMQLPSFGHAWTVHRSWCGGFFHKKFQAFAQTSALGLTTYQTGYDALGRWVGKNPIATWYTLCNKSDKGCSRPRVASCLNSGYITDYIYSGPYLILSTSHYYYAYAKAEYYTSGTYLTQWSFGRGYAGYNDTVAVDSVSFSKLNEKGPSVSEITADSLDVSDAGIIAINKLNGSLSIDSTSDFYSKFQLLVFKERDDVSDADAERTDSLAELGIFENIIDSSEIIVTKGKVIKTGIFSHLTAEDISALSDSTATGVSLNNISLTAQLNVSLAPHEHLSLVALVDGGLDISSAVIDQSMALQMHLPINSNAGDGLRLYPNPANHTLSVQVYSASDDAAISIKAFDVLGREIGTVYSGTLHKGANTISDIDVSGLPRGIHVLQVKNGNKTSNHKIVLE